MFLRESTVQSVQEAVNDWRSLAFLSHDKVRGMFYGAFDVLMIHFLTKMMVSSTCGTVALEVLYCLQIRLLANSLKVLMSTT